MERRRLYWVVTVLVVFLTATANWAGPTTWPPGETTDSWIARFEAPQQSIWSQGGGVTAPGITRDLPYTIGDGVKFEAGVGCDLRINSGSLAGNVEGRIKASYPGYLSTPGSASVLMSYAPLSLESQIHTSLGATGELTANIGVDMPWPAPDIDQHWTFLPETVGFDWKGDFTGGLGSTTRRSGDSQTLFSIGADVVVAGLNADVALYQEVFLKPLDIDGYLNCLHMETQESTPVPFRIDADHTEVSVPLNLDKPGHWEIAVAYLDLESTFSHKIEAAITGSAWVVGVGDFFECGPRFGIWENPEFNLDFTGVEMLGRFNIYVDSVPPGPVIPADTTTGSPAVPAPGAVWLLGVGLSVLAVGRRRCRRWAGASR